jgi:hypothetical protein
MKMQSTQKVDENQPDAAFFAGRRSCPNRDELGCPPAVDRSLDETAYPAERTSGCHPAAQAAESG